MQGILERLERIIASKVYEKLSLALIIIGLIRDISLNEKYLYILTGGIGLVACGLTRYCIVHHLPYRGSR